MHNVLGDCLQFNLIQVNVRIQLPVCLHAGSGFNDKYNMSFIILIQLS